MIGVKAEALPDNTLLEKYRVMQGAYTDSFSLVVKQPVNHADFVFAFYTSYVFKLERAILSLWINKPSTDLQAEELAAGGLDQFAAWTVERRSPDQLLMCDIAERTRSWLMVVSETDGGNDRTTLYFGSAIVPVKNRKTGVLELGWVFRMLLGFHRLYSRVLLISAKARLQKLS